LIASLACEVNIAPSVLMQQDDLFLDAMIDYVRWRAEQSRKKTR
jgi:hypothetical protein